ncbi:MAG: histone-like protein [Limisphaerales bacterium]
MARPTNVEKKSPSVISKDKKESAKFPGAATKSADAGAPAAGKKRKSKPSRRRPGTRPKWERNAMRAIKRAAKSTTPNIPRAAYKRIFKEIGNECSLNGGVRWTNGAVDIIIAAAESSIGNLFEKASKLTDLRSKKTISLQDLQSVRLLDSMGNN